MADVPNIENIYTLSHMQEGILFHSLLDKDTGVFIEQLVCSISGDLAMPSFCQAWQQVIKRHDVLRTGFVWEDLEKPVQIVYRQASLLIEILDFGNLNEVDQARELDEYLCRDRKRGFDLSTAPLMRVAVIRLKDHKFKFIWTNHHLIFDAWCTKILIREVLAFYESIRLGTPCPLLVSIRPYGDYIAWTKRKKMSHSENFWRRELRGFKTPTPLPLKNHNRRGMGETVIRQQSQILLSEGVTASLNILTRCLRTTLNTLLQGTWALILGNYSGARDVVFGAVFSGRPSELDGVGSMVGLFINTLPIRIQIEPNTPFDAWIKNIHHKKNFIHRHEFCPLSSVQGWSDVPRDKSLFESILVFQNSGLNVENGLLGSLVLEHAHSIGHSNFPLAVRIDPRSQLVVEMIYDSEHLDSSVIKDMLNQFEFLLGYICNNSDATLMAMVDALIHIEKGRKIMDIREKRQLFKSKLKAIKLRKIRISQQDLITTEHLLGGSKLPLIVKPKGTRDLDIVSWAQNNVRFIEENLLKYGGILFRGFKEISPSGFREFMKCISKELLEYRERSTPRTDLGDKIYTSTEYPPDQNITFHNEFSYALSWPMNIGFFCVKPADVGGETPISDSRKMLELVDRSVVEKFARKGIMYVRNYGSGIDLPWQEVFQTNNKKDVEAYCRKACIEFEWGGEDRLRTTQVRSALATHPVTGETVWFNQAHLFHMSNLDSDLRASMLDIFTEDELPRNAYYGDGTCIETRAFEEIRKAYQIASVKFNWQESDTLLLDNMLVAHGRNSFKGSRKILAAMAQSYASLMDRSKKIQHKEAM